MISKKTQIATFRTGMHEEMKNNLTPKVSKVENFHETSKLISKKEQANRLERSSRECERVGAGVRVRCGNVLFISVRLAWRNNQQNTGEEIWDRYACVRERVGIHAVQKFYDPSIDQ